MKRPKLHEWAPNIDGCKNAIECADEGKWDEAVDWLEGEGRCALEENECSDNYDKAEAYLKHKAKKAKVKLPVH